jgi:hypothetical protein
MAGYQDFLKKYTKNDNKISQADIQAFADAGGSKEQAQKFINKAIEGKGGYGGKVGEGVVGALETIYASAPAPSPSPSPAPSPAPSPSSSSSASSGNSAADYAESFYGAGVTPAVFDRATQERLQNIKGQYELDYADVVGSNNVLVQQLITDSRNYLGELESASKDLAGQRSLELGKYQADTAAETSKYLGDVEAENALAVQTLKNQGSIDLQAIVNTGLQDVADIQGAYASERVKLQGGFDVERANIQADFEKFKAARSKEAQMYGSLFAGFWN